MRISVVCLLSLLVGISAGTLFPLAIIHINDFHDRFEEVSLKGGPCVDTSTCIGGYARLVTVVKKLKREHKNVLFLNGGDNFQGTPWYSILLGNVTADMLNVLPADAMTLGNHEFDHYPEKLAMFLDAFTTPVLAANIDISREPVLTNKTQNRMVVTKDNRRIGVIGVTYDETHKISNTGNVTFTNSTAAVIKEAEALKQEGVDIVIVLSHCGYDIDKEMASHTRDLVDVFVGGHSHTYLSNDVLLPTNDTIGGPYPTIVQFKKHKTLIVQAGAHSKYVGDLVVYFDDDGEIQRWEGGLVYASHDIKKDMKIEKKLEPWRAKVKQLAGRILGLSKQEWKNLKCYDSECEVGMLTTDAIVDWYKANKRPIDAAFLHAGCLRANLKLGNITYGDLLRILPFTSSIDIFKLQGRYIVEALENSARLRRNNNRNLLQVSGMEYRVDFSKPINRTISDVKIMSNGQLEELDVQKYYTLATTSFLLQGGDDFTMLREHKTDVKSGDIDVDILTSYVQQLSTISQSSLNCSTHNKPCRIHVFGGET